MSGSKKNPRNNKPSIAGGRSKLEGAYFDLADFVHEGHVPSANVTKGPAKAELKSPEILTTKELISAAGQLWNRVSPLDVLEPKARLNRNDSFHKNVIFGDLGGKDIGKVLTFNGDGGDCKHLRSDMKKASAITTMVQPKLKFLRISQKLAILEPRSENFIRPLFQKFSKGYRVFSSKSPSVNSLQTVGFSFELEKLYGWMKEIFPVRSRHPVKVIECEIIEKCESSSAGITFNDKEGCISKDETHPEDKITFRSVDSCDNSIRSIDKTLSYSSTVVPYTYRGTGSSLCSDYFLGVLEDNKMNDNISSTQSSDYQIDYMASYKGTYEEFQDNTDDNEMPRNNSEGHGKHVIKEKSRLEMKSLCGRPHYSPPKREHAFAGACAGIFVSICLHPIDTIKTIIQSCHAEQKSVYLIGRSIISEKGVTALYRGITGNIASSAPISAIYTFTYESVKGSLIPLIPKEYQSVAPCIAGGCASIATSFVFTPSERIKQQMQIGSHYYNSWNAFVGIIQKGGIPSLYTGWGAVLCRNIPHSIIKVNLLIHNTRWRSPCASYFERDNISELYSS